MVGMLTTARRKAATWENIQELRGVASDYTHSAFDDPLTEFLEDVSLVSDTDTREEITDAPTLMTFTVPKVWNSLW